MIWWIPAIFSSFPVTSSPVGLPRTHTFLCHYIWPSIFLPAYLEPIGCCCCDPNLQTIASHYHHDRIVDTDCSEKINRNILFSTCIVFPPSPRVSRVPADTVPSPAYNDEDTSHWWSPESFSEAISVVTYLQLISHIQKQYEALSHSPSLSI